MTDIFNTDVFHDWGEKLVDVIQETATLIYDDDEIETITNGGSAGSTETRRDFSFFIIEIIVKAVTIKINKHRGEPKTIGYLLLVLVMLDKLKESIDPSQDQEVLAGIKLSIEYCDVEMRKLEEMLVTLIQELEDIQVQYIHSVLIKDIESWSSKAIDLFTLAEINSVGE